MKLSARFPIILFLAGASLALSKPAPRKLDEKTTDLTNGAVLNVNMLNVNSSQPYVEGAPISVFGNASVGKGDPDVSYIYIIDTSDSTWDWDGDCGTVLQCVQAFFQQFNMAAIADGSAELVSVINFDDAAYVDAELQDPRNSSSIVSSIMAGQSDGGTNCTAALLKAAALVRDIDNSGGTTVVIFAGDGACNEEADEVKNAAAELGNTSAIVHSVAVGDTVDCEQSQEGPNNMNDIPQNAGKCHSVVDPNDLPHIIDDLIGTNLTNLAIQVDNGNYTDISNANLTQALPQEGAISVDFDTAVVGLAVGSHEICVRATGRDVLGGEAKVEDCHDVLVVEKDGLQGWQVFLIVASVLGTVFLLAYCAVTFRNGKEDPGPTDLELDESPHTTSPTVLAVGVV